MTARPTPELCQGRPNAILDRAVRSDPNASSVHTPLNARLRSSAARALLLPALAALPGPRQALAQVPYSACLDRHQQVIPATVDNTMYWSGMATVRNGHPVILWNASRNQTLPDYVQMFIYMHECAHHLLGHVYQPDDSGSRKREDEADCWALQLLVDGGILKASQIDALEAALRNGQGDSNHRSGDDLIHSLARCLEIRTDKAAWDTALTAFVAASADSFRTSRGRLIESGDHGAIYESALDAPGTYDCEIVGGSVRCLVFASRSLGPATHRYDVLVKVYRAWLSGGWTSREDDHPPDGLARRFMAQETESGALITLLLTPDARLYFAVRRM
jgi:hypothetical protein